MSETTTDIATRDTTIVVATGNPGKLREMRALLGPSVRVESAADAGAVLPEETGTTFEANAVLKAVAVARQTGKVAIADDSGLQVDALGGSPGVFSARYAGQNATEADNRRKLLTSLKDVEDARRQARFVSVIAIAFAPDDVVTAEGRCEGSITHEERGEGGFGYDSLFLLPTGQTMAEIATEEKNRISHRAHAMNQARHLLRARLADAERRRETSTTTEVD
ncbi:MAG TPA: RdgB/HAM1 family non-canonical purine NTP pyrophosphatase [Thermomicrobiales bacterium]|nr:RdgB/HAM1 family non-canonical purine NTP pyrophosphatase [Thermomicrobiales bacterium]